MHLRVVAVDDEPEVLQSVKTLLQALECDVVTFADSRDAAQHLLTNKADGVFLDVALRHLDGFELARRIRGSELNAKVPIVMLTTLSDAETMRKGFEAGVTLATRKPVNLEGLRKVVTVIRTTVLREKRQYQRVEFDASVVVRWKNQKAELRSVDISERGMLLEGGELPEGQEVEISFQLAQLRQPLVSRAKVLRRVPPNRVGIGFLHMTPQFRQALLKYLLKKHP